MLLFVVITFGLVGSMSSAPEAMAATRVIDGKTVSEGTKRFVSVKKPTICGTRAVGRTLTAEHGDSHPAAQAWTYQWYRSGKAIVGATGRTYRLVAADLASGLLCVRRLGATVMSGRRRRCRLRRRRSASGRFIPRLQASRARGTSTRPCLRSLAGGPPAPISYQWLRDGKVISKATKATHVLDASDLGKRISFTVTGKLSGYKTKA